MCMRTTCKKCQKLSYSGCGKHLDKLFAGVDQSDLCTCSLIQSTEDVSARNDNSDVLLQASGAR